MGTLIPPQLTIFLLVAVGFFVKKTGLVGPQGQKNINDLVIYIVLPCNILKAFMVEFSRDKLIACLAILLLSIGIQAFCVVYGKLLYKNQPEGKRKCLQYGIICPNGGFLGNPIAEGVFGPEGLLLASVFLIPQRIMMWSSGLAVFSGSTDRKKTMKKVLLHPCVLACAAGTVLMVTQLQLPGFLKMTITSLGNCNTALSMMVIGMILSAIDPHTLIDRTVIRYTIQRLVVLPAMVWALCLLLQALHLPVSHLVTGVTVLLTAMPAGATTSILAEKYDMEPEFATKMVIFSTLLSLPSICLWSMVLV